MWKSLAIIAVLILVFAVPGHGADRKWQTGKWVDVGTKRQMMDFGPGSTSFDPRGRGPSMRAMADVRTYVIETDEQRIELQDVVSVNKRSVDAVIGQPVTFALEKNTLYVKDADGAEHKLRVMKKGPKERGTFSWWRAAEPDRSGPASRCQAAGAVRRLPSPRCPAAAV
jgi:hypothetical protein